MEYRFTPGDLSPDERKPGISAIMRLRNSEDFLEAVVASHAPYFDEIVAVHNRCTDRTPEILANLQERFPGKITVHPYEPRVFPSGTPGHRSEPPESPHSLVNYSNFALTRSTRRIVTLLDDDHVAIRPQVARLTSEIRRARRLGRAMWCFSGLNLDVGKDGSIGVRKAAPFAGNGDHGFFEVTSRTYFEHDKRFERLRYQEFQRRYHGLAYWHLKYLKKGHGFNNYELEDNPDSRYRRHRNRFLKHRETIPIELFLDGFRSGRLLATQLSRLPLPERMKLKLARYGSLHGQVQREDIEELLNAIRQQTARRSDTAFS